MKKSAYTVPRQFAAEILNVSTRTLDRYTKSNKIRALRRGRQLFFAEQELLNFKAKAMAKSQYDRLKQSKQDTPTRTRKASSRQTRRHVDSHPEADFPEVERAQVVEARVSEFDGDLDGGFAEIRDSLLRRSPEESIFKALYEKTEGEVKGLREKLEQAHLHIGQLQEQIKRAIPRLEHRKQRKQLLALEERSRCQLEELAQLEKQIRSQAFLKRCYALLLFGFLLLLPILFSGGLLG